MKFTYLTTRLIGLYLAGIVGTILWFVNDRPLSLYLFVVFVGWFFSNCGTIGYHRWLTHRTFEPTFFGRYLMLFGLLVESFGHPIHLVVAHRLHHKYSDMDGDPHSPKHLSYIDMLMGKFSKIESLPPLKDVLRMKDVVWFDKHYWKLWWAFNIILALIDWQLALIFCPVIFIRAWVMSQGLNYFGHSGKKCEPKNFGTFLSCFTGGEYLHKNHHAMPSNYRWDTPDSAIDLGGVFVEKFLMKR